MLKIKGHSRQNGVGFVSCVMYCDFLESILYCKIYNKVRKGIDMSVLFVEYPKCSTCQKAKKWLDEHNVSYEDRHIKEQNPTAEELKAWHEKSGRELKKFFNTSGMLYKEMALKDKLPGMSPEEQYALLATDGMLVKRPVLVTEKTVLTGFKEAEWEAALENE